MFLKNIVQTQPKHTLYTGILALPKGCPKFCATNKKHRFCVSCSLISSHLRGPLLVSWGSFHQFWRSPGRRCVHRRAGAFNIKGLIYPRLPQTSCYKGVRRNRSKCPSGGFLVGKRCQYPRNSSCVSAVHRSCLPVPSLHVYLSLSYRFLIIRGWVLCFCTHQHLPLGDAQSWLCM